MLQPIAATSVDRQTQLAAPPENVLGGLRPFFGHQIVDFVRMQAGAEVLAQVLHTIDSLEQQPAATAVAARPALGQALVEPGVAQAQRFGQLAHVAHVLAAGQRRMAGPGRLHVREPGREFGERRFGQLAIGGQLAAEHRQQWRVVRLTRELEGVVTGNRRWLARLVIAQRAYPGIAMADVGALQRALEMLVHHSQEVVDLLLGDANLRRVAVVFAVGGADQAEAVQIGNHEHHAAIAVLQDVGMLAVVQPGHDQVAALNQADAMRR